MTLQSLDLLHFLKQEIDTARLNPQKVADYLSLRKFIDGTQFKHSQLNNVHYRTEEGQAAVDEAIEYLRTINKRSKMKLSGSLCEVSYRVGVQMAKEKQVQNVDFYRQMVKSELQKIVKSWGSIQIIIQYGFRMDTQIIPSIIVDDGDAKRTRRDSLLEEKNKFVGISVHEHQQFDFLVILLISDNIVENNSCECSLI